MRPSSGSRSVSFAVEDAASLTLADASVDGVLCRWGLMLVPPGWSRGGRDRARSPARAAAPPSRSGPTPEQNDWMTASGRSALELGLHGAAGPERAGAVPALRRGRLGRCSAEAGLEVEVVEDVPLTWRAPSLGGVVGDITRDMSRMLAVLAPAAQPRRGRGGATRAPSGAWSATSSRTGRSPCRASRASRSPSAAERVHAVQEEWRGPDLNRRHHGFQPCALPTELPRPGTWQCSRAPAEPRCRSGVARRATRTTTGPGSCQGNSIQRSVRCQT